MEAPAGASTRHTDFKGVSSMTMRILTAGDPAHARACGHVLAPDTALALSETGSASLIDLSGAVHALTPVAAEMVARTLETGREAAVSGLAQKYDAAPERIAADLDKLWSSLVARGILEVGVVGY
jgi:hypothetical protein